MPFIGKAPDALDLLPNSVGYIADPASAGITGCLAAVEKLSGRGIKLFNGGDEPEQPVGFAEVGYPSPLIPR